MADWNDNALLQEREPYITSSKVDMERCEICGNDIVEGQHFEVYGSFINPRYVHEICRKESEK